MADTTQSTTAKTTLPKDIFGVDVPNHELLKLAYDMYLAQARSAGARTKTRGLVSGGGKKPWRQKGTGRARFGSSRNPIWRGGGIVFGPTGNENYKKKLSKTSKRVAVRQALTLANQAGKVIVMNSFACPQGKVKEAVAALAKHKVGDNERVLLVVKEKSDTVLRATNNLGHVKVARPTYLSVFDILNADKILITKESLPEIRTWLVKEEATV